MATLVLKIVEIFFSCYSQMTFVHSHKKWELSANMGKMSAWERLEREMHRKRKSVHDLARVTGASLNAIWHWKSRGIPARHMRACAELVGRQVDWLELGVDPSPDLLAACQMISAHLESWGDYDRQTVVSRLSTLAHSPKLYEVVATGLESLPKQEP